mgnify:CR=1 FL=1
MKNVLMIFMMIISFLHWGNSQTYPMPKIEIDPVKYENGIVIILQCIGHFKLKSNKIIL